jgi:hypothetical protein
VEYQALPEFTQMRVLEAVMRMLLHTAMLFLALTLGCIACLCVYELRKSRPSRSRPRATPEKTGRAMTACRFSTRS